MWCGNIVKNMNKMVALASMPGVEDKEVKR